MFFVARWTQDEFEQTYDVTAAVTAYKRIREEDSSWAGKTEVVWEKTVGGGFAGVDCAHGVMGILTYDKVTIIDPKTGDRITSLETGQSVDGFISFPAGNGSFAIDDDGFILIGVIDFNAFTLTFTTYDKFGNVVSDGPTLTVTDGDSHGVPMVWSVAGNTVFAAAIHETIIAPEPFINRLFKLSIVAGQYKPATKNGTGGAHPVDWGQYDLDGTIGQMTWIQGAGNTSYGR
jgi:hypothetical protein